MRLLEECCWSAASAPYARVILSLAGPEDPLSAKFRPNLGTIGGFLLGPACSGSKVPVESRDIHGLQCAKAA